MVFALIHAGANLQAAPRKPTFSSELEFTNATIMRGKYWAGDSQVRLSEQNLAAQEEWAEKMKKICAQTKKCSVQEIYDTEYSLLGDDGETVYLSEEYPNYRVKYKNGFYYDVTLDPSTIEIKLKPMTLEETKKNAETIQKDIFDFAQSIGLHPPRDESSQIHIGMESSFGARNEMTENFRNFILGMVHQHQELWLLWVDDTSNAPPLSSLHESQTLAFEAIIEDLDKKLIKNYQDFCKRMKRDVYGETFDADMVSDYDPANKYQAVNVNRLCKAFSMQTKTVEFRSLPPQRSAETIIKLYTFFDAYVNWITTHPGKHPLKRFNPKKSNYHEWIRDYLALLRELKLNPKDYVNLVQPKYREHCARKLRRQ